MSNAQSLDSLAALEATVAEVLDAFLRAQHAEPAGGWGPREVMAHFAAWQDWETRCAEAYAAGLPLPPLPAPGVDALNDLAAADARHTPMADYATRIGDLLRRLRAAIEALPDADAIQWPRANGETAPAPRRIAAWREHYREHLDELRRGGPLSP